MEDYQQLLCCQFIPMALHIMTSWKPLYLQAQVLGSKEVLLEGESQWTFIKENIIIILINYCTLSN